MTPLFNLECKEPFREFNTKLNEIKKIKSQQVKYFEENAVNVDVTNYERKHRDDDNSFFTFNVSMPLYFLSGYQGMNYSDIQKKHKEKRSSGEIKRNDLIYLARVTDDLRIIRYETLAFVEKVYRCSSDPSDSSSSSGSDLDSDDDLLDDLPHLKSVKPTTPYNVRCSQRMTQSEIDEFYHHIKRESGRWICLYIMSFGSVKKEYDALMLSMSGFMRSTVITGKFNSSSNILLGKLSNATTSSITKEVAQARHLNEAQASILEKVYNRRLSLIQGPPGTGKTTLILALIQRELMVEKAQNIKTKVLVCAPSNFACDEIYRRLEKEKEIKSFRYVVDETRSKDVLMANIREAQVVICTLCSSGNQCIKDFKKEFSLLIMDEASQATELTTLIPFRYEIPQTIIVGDQKQLPPTVKNSIAERQGNYGVSFFERLQQNNPTAVHLLNTQYRMHPHISKLSSSLFYDNKIKNGDNVLSKKWVKAWCMDPKFGPLRFYNVEGEMRKGDSDVSIYNETEATQVLNFIQQLLKTCPHIYFSKRIAIISPYRAQVSLIKRKLHEYFEGKMKDMFTKIDEKRSNMNEDIIKRFKTLFKETNILDFISVNTVDSYQGQENDMVILSTVRSKTWQLGFLKDDRRLNVAITRARHSLIIFGDEKTLSKSTSWKKMIKDIKKMNGFVPVSISDYKFIKMERKKNFFFSNYI